MQMIRDGVMTLVVLALLAPAYATATGPSVQCKECIMKCVMDDNKQGFNCLRIHPAAPACACDTLCMGADRTALMKEVHAEALSRCAREFDECKRNAGGDNALLGICDTDTVACRKKTTRMH